MNVSRVTEEVSLFVETNECFWFLDVINSYQTTKHVNDTPFQVWTFKKNKTGNGCVVTCEDGDKNIVKRQRIPFTDLELKTFTMWLINGTIMFPNEY
jgi:hypothetical protein